MGVEVSQFSGLTIEADRSAYKAIGSTSSPRRHGRNSALAILCREGRKPVIEDLPAVLRRIEHWHQGSVAHLELMFIDADGTKVAGQVVRAFS
ncbi:MAG: hypothetical protein WB586_01080 [Chthoniobacterales bacterium]